MPDPTIITDTWTGDDDDPWDPTIWPIIRDVRAALSPTPWIASNAGHLQCGPGDCVIAAFTAPTLANFDMTFRMHIPDTTDEDFVLIGYRIGTNIASGAPTDGCSIVVIHHANTVNFETSTSGVADIELQVHDLNIDDGAERWWRIRVKGDQHMFKFWTVGDAEPLSWRAIITEATYTSGRVYLAIGAYPDAAEVVFDDFTLTELLPPDPGFRIGSTETVAMYVGAEPVVAAYLGDAEIPVP